MPRLTPATQAKRREHILEAAEQCFARAGFHRTTMNDICREAGVSAGALYIYFPSKEALIAGLCERDRAEFSRRFSELSAAPDLLEALGVIAQQYFVDEPAHKRLLTIEVGVESTRNPEIGELFHTVDNYVRESFEALFGRLKAEGRIDPIMSIEEVTRLFLVLGDGLFWRRAISPSFDAATSIAAVLQTLATVLRPATLPASLAIPAGASAPARTSEKADA